MFKSDAMLTVATQIEAPAKFLWAAVREAGDTRYPFSVLGLGDVRAHRVGSWECYMRRLVGPISGTDPRLTTPERRAVSPRPLSREM